MAAFYVFTGVAALFAVLNLIEYRRLD